MNKQLGTLGEWPQNSGRLPKQSFAVHSSIRSTQYLLKQSGGLLRRLLERQLKSRKPGERNRKQ